MTNRQLVFAIFTSLLATTGCSDRTLDKDWEERVAEVCEAVCPVSACNPHNPFYEDEEGCVENCTTSDAFVERTDCAEATLAISECFSGLTCEEAISYTEAVQAGEETSICEGPLLEQTEVCTGGQG
jgi:hypothetical protein